MMMAAKAPGQRCAQSTDAVSASPLIAVHPEAILRRKAFQLQSPCSRYRRKQGGVLESSFIAEVKSDLMGEQTILCGMPVGSFYVLTGWLNWHRQIFGLQSSSVRVGRQSQRH